TRATVRPAALGRPGAGPGDGAGRLRDAADHGFRPAGPGLVDGAGAADAWRRRDGPGLPGLVRARAAVAGPGTVPGPAGAGRAHGPDQLPDAVGGLHHDLLRLRPRVFRATAPGLAAAVR